MEIDNSLKVRPPFVVVAGTGTDVGKTICAASLLFALRKKGILAQAVKPVQTGVEPEKRNVSPQSDASAYLSACASICSENGLPPAETLKCFPLAASPHLAAREMGEMLTVADIKKNIQLHCQDIDKKDVFFIFECAGGLMAPFNDHETGIDLLCALKAPVILVCRNELGALNHALMSMRLLAENGIELAGFCFTPGVGAKAVLIDNVEYLRRRLGDVPLVEMPYLEFDSHFPSWDTGATAIEPITTWIETKILNTLQSLSKPCFLERDHKTIWHPYASSTSLPLLEEVSHTRQNRIVLENGKELIDGMSSWWAAIHGYNNPGLLSALAQQSAIMPHIMFGGLTHEPAVTLAERLLNHMPHGLSRIFFADSGSVAVEVALKMALQYQIGAGKPEKTRFLTPLGGYHGDTFGAMSVSDPVNGMHSLFNGILAHQFFFPRPDCPFEGDINAPFNDDSLTPVRELLRKNKEEIAAIILEPVVQGAGGMWFYHPKFLHGIREISKKYDILLIVDEIATGFGRTGKFFASDWASISPDILCCGKALTGGMMTLAATVCTENVANTICARGLPFMHGPTYMANPLACAVAGASLDILERKTWVKQVAEIEGGLKAGLAPCRFMPGVADVRSLGAIGVVEMEKPVNLNALQGFFVAEGVWIRPFGNLIYLMPPFITPPEDVKALCSAICKAVEKGVWKR